MRRAIVSLWALLVVGVLAPVSPAELRRPESSIAQNLKWVGVAVEEDDYTIWGSSPIIHDGRTHLFVARWPEANVDPAWRKSSEIAHYIADSPEGPFTFRDIAITGTGRDTWDRYSAHNPEIRRYEDKFVLLYISNDDYHQPPHPLNQRIGMAVSDSPGGPWRRVGGDGLILESSPDPDHWTHGSMVVNPTLLKVGERYHLYFKSRDRGRPGTVYGLAIADRLEGPYRMLDEPLTAKGATIEDGSAFMWEGKVCLLTTDNHGHVTGVRGGGVLWVSDDGLHFDVARAQLGYDRLPRYYTDFDESRAKRIYGGDPKLERPKVLMIAGRPAYLYGPSGWNITGGDRTVCHVLRIDPTDPGGPESRAAAP